MQVAVRLRCDLSGTERMSSSPTPMDIFGPSKQSILIFERRQAHDLDVETIGYQIEAESPVHYIEVSLPGYSLFVNGFLAKDLALLCDLLCNDRKPVIILNLHILPSLCHTNVPGDSSRKLRCAHEFLPAHRLPATPSKCLVFESFPDLPRVANKHRVNAVAWVDRNRDD